MPDQTPTEQEARDQVVTTGVDVTALSGLELRKALPTTTVEEGLS